MIDREFNLSQSDEFSSRSDGWEFHVSSEEPRETAQEPADAPRRDARRSRLLVQAASAAMATVVVANAMGVDLLEAYFDPEPMGIVWSIDEDNTLQIGGRGPVGNYYIGNDPPWQEQLDEITGVVFGSGITELRACAVGGAYGLTGPGYENGCHIRSVSLPDSVGYVDPEAFINLELLEEITVDEDNPALSSLDGALYSKDMKTLLFYRGAGERGAFAVPESVTRIERFACRWGQFRSVVLPDGLEEIGDWAFASCFDLRTAAIPDGVTRIGEYAFYCCPLERVVLPASLRELGEYNPFAINILKSIEISPDNPNYITVDGVLFTKDGSTLLACPAGADAYAVPEGVTRIGDGAFCYYSPDRVTLPDSLTEIGWEAFFNSCGILSVEIPAGVTVIRGSAFAFCSNLARVTFKGSPRIESLAFLGCEGLREVRFLGSAPKIASDAFRDCGPLVIRYPAGDSSWDAVAGRDYGAPVTWIAE